MCSSDLGAGYLRGYNGEMFSFCCPSVSGSRDGSLEGSVVVTPCRIDCTCLRCNVGYLFLKHPNNSRYRDPTLTSGEKPHFQRAHELNRTLRLRLLRWCCMRKRLRNFQLHTAHAASDSRNVILLLFMDIIRRSVCQGNFSLHRSQMENRSHLFSRVIAERSYY